MYKFLHKGIHNFTAFFSIHRTIIHVIFQQLTHTPSFDRLVHCAF